MKKQLIFLGGPGSGKGTQAKKMVRDLGCKHVSTGDLLREEVKKGSALGRKVDQILKEGHLVSDDVVFELLKANCDVKTGTYIFDGFPRNINQAKELDRELLDGCESIVFYFDCPHDVLVQRLTSRRICGKCGAIYNIITGPPPSSGICSQCKDGKIEHRKDDQEETILERLKVFKETTGPVVKYYEERGNLVRIDASVGDEETHNMVVRHL